VLARGVQAPAERKLGGLGWTQRLFARRASLVEQALFLAVGDKDRLIGFAYATATARGACGCGLVPSLPMAWQREQFSLTSASPLLVRSLSAANAGNVKNPKTSAVARHAASSFPRSLSVPAGIAQYPLAAKVIRLKS